MWRLLHKKDKEVIIYIKFNFVSPTQRENKEKGNNFTILHFYTQMELHYFHAAYFIYNEQVLLHY